MNFPAGRFELTAPNKYWSQLQEAASYHVSVRDKYTAILEQLKEDHVKFKDIKSYLLNRAKECGLYRKNHWSDKERCMVYPPVSTLSMFSWYVTLTNFTQWIHYNWKEYDVPVIRLPKSNNAPKKVVVEIRKSSTPAKTESKPSVTPEPIKSTLDASGRPPAIVTDVTLPQTEQNKLTNLEVDAGLSKAQIQAIIVRNWYLLADICEAKGATKEFNALMIKLGIPEEVID